jgi:hypothetical protein
MLTPFPGTLDFDKWEKSSRDTPPMFDGTPLTRHWLIPARTRPKYYMPHPTMRTRKCGADAGGVGSVLQPAAWSGSAAAA